MQFISTVLASMERSRFSIGKRKDFYVALALLLGNGSQLSDALAGIFKVYGGGKTNPRNVVAKVARECVIGLGSGHSFSEAIFPWIGYDEYSLLKAGEEAGNLVECLEKATMLLEAKKDVVGAILGCTLYPSVLMALGCFLLYKVAHEIVPKMARGTNQAEWDTPAVLLKALADLVTQQGPILLVVGIVSIVGIVATLPYLRGNIRYYLDKLPPWSIYRMFYGSTFLLNVAVLMSAEVQLNDVLEGLAKRANPWLRERINATRHGIRIGSNLGTALNDAGYDFPDRHAIQFLQVIEGQQGTEANLERFGQDWLKQSVANLKKASGFLIAAAIAANGSFLLFVLAGASGMSDALISNMR